MKSRIPIKRNPAIVELSKDHHFGLLLIWKTREGLKKSIEPERISRYIIHFFETELKTHFKEEEELLFVEVAQNNKLRMQAEAEHKDIYELIENIRTTRGDKDLIQTFANTLEKHIRFEERQLFNYLQDNIPASTLSQIASELKSKEKTPTGWNDVFWENRS